ncbi:hypothetical protein D3C87_1556140 [compost metagenome]
MIPTYGFIEIGRLGIIKCIDRQIQYTEVWVFVFQDFAIYRARSIIVLLQGCSIGIGFFMLIAVSYPP